MLMLSDNLVNWGSRELRPATECSYLQHRNLAGILHVPIEKLTIRKNILLTRLKPLVLSGNVIGHGRRAFRPGTEAPAHKCKIWRATTSSSSENVFFNKNCSDTSGPATGVWKWVLSWKT